jgi:hypothetical protein
MEAPVFKIWISNGKKFLREIPGFPGGYFLLAPGLLQRDQVRRNKKWIRYRN